MSFFEQIFSSRWRYMLLVLLVGIGGGYFFFQNGKNTGATLTIASRDFFKEVRVSGTVIATQNVDLGFAANGRIAHTYVRVGQHITAGTILTETENTDIQALIMQKQATLQAAEANLASLLSGTRPEEIAIASSSVVSAETALISAIQNAYTASDDAVHNKTDPIFTNPRTTPKLSFGIANETLQTSIESNRATIEVILNKWALLVSKITSENVADGAVQSQKYLVQVSSLLADANTVLNQGVPNQTITSTTLSSYGALIATARANVNTAGTALVGAQAELDSAQKNLFLKQAGATNDALTAQRALIASAKADVQNAQALLNKTLITAPFDGVVTRMDAKVGEIASPTVSQVSMQSDGIFEIETYLPEVTISGVVVGNPATTTLDAYGPSAVFLAKVIAVDPAETIKDGVPTYKTTLAFTQADTRIRSGMTSNVVIQTGVLPDAIVIPAGAVGINGTEKYVSLVTEIGVTKRSVTLGPSPALGQAHIIAGLSVGDTILLTPAP